MVSVSLRRVKVARKGEEGEDEEALDESRSTLAATIRSSLEAGSLRSPEDTYGDETDENGNLSKGAVAVAGLMLFLIGFAFTIVIPTARQYAESLHAPPSFEGYVVAATPVGSALMMPLYRPMLKRSFAGTILFQISCIQFGSVLYSLAQVANKLELLVAGRILIGLGSSYYPVYQLIAEKVGKRHRSLVMSVCSVGRSMGFCLGPVFAAIIVYVDFHIGDLVLNKETNAGWTVAIFCAAQIFLVVWQMPKEGSKLVGKKKTTSSPSSTAATAARTRRDVDSSSEALPGKEKFFHIAMLAFVCMNGSLPSFFNAAWVVSATRVIQTQFHWSVQYSALLVGGIGFTPAISSPAVGMLSRRGIHDKLILLGCALLQLVSAVTLFDFGSPVVYLIGSVFYFNGTMLQSIFSFATSSKVCYMHEVEPMQTWINTISLLFRAAGAIGAASLTTNQLAVTCVAGALLSLAGTLVFYRRLTYKMN